jgi:hypothetical protein
MTQSIAEPVRPPEAEMHAPGGETAAAISLCTNCGASFATRFCGECGQERLPDDDLTLRAFARKAAHDVLDVDSTLVRTLRRLMTKPGALTVDFVAGRRKAWVGPVKLYLMVAVAYFLVMWPFMTRLQGNPQEAMRTFPGIEKVAARKDITVDELVRRMDGQMRTTMQAFTNFGAIPLVAGVLALLYRRQRRRYAEHLAFTLHTSTQAMVVAGIYAVPLTLLALATGKQLPGWVTWLTMPYLFWYTLASARTVYGRERSRRRMTVYFVANALLMGVVGFLSVITALYLA